MTDPTWQAAWIWPAGHAWTVNFHGFARREFTLEDAPDSAVLHISAYTDYVVFVNGHSVGRGPEPNDSWFQTFDTYDVRPWLTPGPNVLAVVCHNFAVGVHWSHRGRGGLIAQLDLETHGEWKTVATDASWHVAPAECYPPNSPRMFWSASFAETFDFHRYDPAWSQPGFDDAHWQTPDVLGPPGTKPWTRLLPREIPLLRETPTAFVAAERGRFSTPTLHAVSLAPILPPGRSGLVHAATTLSSEAEREVTLHIECDDAFKMFVNGALVAEQNYSEYFARTRVWRGKDEYDQVHDGMGDAGYWATVRLTAGENSVTVAVDQGPGGWGFLLAVLDAETGPTLDMGGPWRLYGPSESTGLFDSLDGVSADTGTLGAVAWQGDCRDLTVGTDYATIMSYERRGQTHSADWETFTMQAGEFCILDLGVVRVGYPRLTLEATEEAVLDIGYGQILTDDKRLRYSNGGRMKYVDRVSLPPGTYAWQPYERRTARFLHLSCRRGSLTINRPEFLAVGYPVERLGGFECADPKLNRIWETSVYTTELLMQQGYQDCLKREGGTLNTSSFNYASRGAACAFGDFALAKKNIRQALRTQNETGWFDSHGISSPNSDEPTECLWLAVWLKDYLRFSGDREFAAEVFDSIEDNLRYWNKGINRHGLLEGRNRPIYWRGQGIYLDDSYLYGPYTGGFEGELSGLNMLYAAAMEAASTLAREIGRPDRAAYWGRRAVRVRQSLNARFWDADRGLYRDWRDGEALGQTYHPIIQITALYFGLGNAAQTEALLRYLEDDLGLPDERMADYPLFTFGYYFYLLEILFRHGRDQMAYDLLRRFYGRWLELGGTTFGEFFEPWRLRAQNGLTEEYEVHAYGTSAHLHFYTNILGVTPLEPGFQRVHIAPRPGDLAWAKGTVATPRGPIHVSWRQSADTFVLEIEAPQDCACVVQPPTTGEAHVTLNGRPWHTTPESVE